MERILSITEILALEGKVHIIGMTDDKDMFVVVTEENN